MFVGPLRDAIAEHSPQARVAPVDVAPVAGSLLLAARLCGDSASTPKKLADVVEPALAAAR